MDRTPLKAALWKVEWTTREYRGFSHVVKKARENDSDVEVPATIQQDSDGAPCVCLAKAYQSYFGRLGNGISRKVIESFRSICSAAMNEIDKDGHPSAWSVFRVSEAYSTSVPMEGRDLFTDATNKHVIGRFFFALSSDNRELHNAFIRLDEDQNETLRRHMEVLKAVSKASRNTSEVKPVTEYLEVGTSTIQIEEKPGFDEEVYLASDRLLFIPKGLSFVFRARPGLPAYYLSWCILDKNVRNPTTVGTKVVVPTRKVDTYTCKDLEHDVESFTNDEMKAFTTQTRGKRRMSTFSDGKSWRKSTKDYISRKNAWAPEFRDS